MIRLVITVVADDASPRQLRARFACALREAVIRAALTGRLDIAYAEELWRAIPHPERA
jgi:hypothetical protein